jgi:hypothetical protein
MDAPAPRGARRERRRNGGGAAALRLYLQAEGARAEHVQRGERRVIASKPLHQVVHPSCSPRHLPGGVRWARLPGRSRSRRRSSRQPNDADHPRGGPAYVDQCGELTQRFVTPDSSAVYRVNRTRVGHLHARWGLASSLRM